MYPVATRCSALGIGSGPRSGVAFGGGTAKLEGAPHLALFRVVEHAPHRDLVERAETPRAAATHLIDRADAVARGRHRTLRRRTRRIHAASGALAFSARATRDTGGR